MATLIASINGGDIEQGITRRCSDARANEDEEGTGCSDEERSSSECCRTEIVGGGVGGGEKGRSSSSSSSSCGSDCSVVGVVDLESGGGGGVVVEPKVSVHLVKVERDCRICHLSLDGSNPECGFSIELGCSCRDDLAAAHKQCAETWFKIRGNKTCEICGSIARNVVGVNEVETTGQWDEVNDPAAMAITQPNPADTRRFWQGHRFLNFLLACMVFAFVISWLFHFNVPS